MRALLLGNCHDLLRSLPFLLSRCGFEVDLISWGNSLVFKNRFISLFEIFDDRISFLCRICEIDLQLYDWVVVFDDGTLKAIENLDISLEKKLKILPVQSEKDFCHLYSKIGLSKILQQNNIPTPDFCVIESKSELFQKSQILGFPLLAKIDSSGGGHGVFECDKFEDLEKIPTRFFAAPFLIQKKIEGQEYDLSSLYLKGHLIHFTRSEILQTVKKFAPSVVRRYYQLSQSDQKLFELMQSLGSALGANGFCNVSAMKCVETGEFFIFEADMRPNVWVDSSHFIGYDLAVKIREYFSEKKIMKLNAEINQNFPATLIIPYCFRMQFWEILCNRHKLWKFITINEAWQVILMRMRNGLWSFNRIPTLTIRKILPCKTKRKALKNSLRRFIKYA